MIMLSNDQADLESILFILLGGLSGACAKLELASSKNNEMLEINALHKFTLHALSDKAVNVSPWPRFRSKDSGCIGHCQLKSVKH